MEKAAGVLLDCVCQRKMSRLQDPCLALQPQFTEEIELIYIATNNKHICTFVSLCTLNSFNLLLFCITTTTKTKSLSNLKTSSKKSVELQLGTQLILDSILLYY